MTVTEDQLEELETALEYLDRARDMLWNQGQQELAHVVQSVLEQLEEHIIDLEEELGLTE